MECEAVVERLPWLMNGSLPPDEERDLRAHLAQCPACQAELELTREAGALFGAHPSEDELIELALERPVAAHVAAHARGCAACADELALLRASRTDTLSAPAGRGRPIRWPVLSPAWGAALAAALVAGVAVGAWMRVESGQREAALRGAARDAAARADHLAAENDVWRARLEAATTAVDVNPLVVELYPETARRAPLGGAAAVIELAAPDARVTLLLQSEHVVGPGPFDVALRAGERVLWSEHGLRRQPTADFTLTLPASRLPVGSLTLTLSSPRSTAGPVEIYRLEVRPAPRRVSPGSPSSTNGAQ